MTTRRTANIDRSRSLLIAALLSAAAVPGFAFGSAAPARAHAAGGIEIVLQGARGEGRVMVHPMRVTATAATSSSHTVAPAHRAPTRDSRGVARGAPARSPRDGTYVAYHRSGLRSVQGQLRGDLPHGTWHWFDRRGRVFEERNYAFGNLHGPLRIWRTNGRLAEEYHYVGGRLNGVARTWHANGRLASEHTYRDGHLHGWARTWSPAGHLSSEQRYRGGRTGSSRQRFAYHR